MEKKMKAELFSEAGGKQCKPHQNSLKTGFVLGKRKKLSEPVLTAYLQTITGVPKHALKDTASRGNHKASQPTCPQTPSSKKNPLFMWH